MKMLFSSKTGDHIPMDSRSRGRYACEPRTVETSAAMRLLAAIALLLATCTAGGCISTQLKATTNRPVEANMKVFVKAPIAQYAMDSVCMFPFRAPPEMAAASPMLTSTFQARLDQRGPFQQIRVLPYKVKSDSEALWYARKEGCSLVILPSLLYMMDGTGAMPTDLVVRMRILDARTGEVLWDVKQSAWSEPGRDIDLTWNTITGAPAQRCRVLADCLAQRFAEYLAQPLDKEKKEAAGFRQ